MTSLHHNEQKPEKQRYVNLEFSMEVDSGLESANPAQAIESLLKSGASPQRTVRSSVGRSLGDTATTVASLGDTVASFDETAGLRQRADGVLSENQTTPIVENEVATVAEDDLAYVGNAQPQRITAFPPRQSSGVFSSVRSVLVALLLIVFIFVLLVIARLEWLLSSGAERSTVLA